ncbi:glycosyltransferase [Alteribacter keqinensis]|uniref:Glycosyltransferase n=1 Tax=Alteribacter keqinensis TaxID=2483800 RepID=A0A3M7TPN4_9BACI|nr:glycosyltransferase [Alteribacter keqinensis]RNA67594.1 glycosyltransferase [Alteribacter keqinensis]
MTETKKVVHITTVHHPLDPRIYYKQCMSLHDAGYKVTLIAPYSEDLTHENSVPVKTFKKHTNRFVSMLVSPIKAYKMAKSLKADYYHFHDPELLPVGWLLKKRNNIVIYDIHEDYETGIVQRNYLNKPLRWLLSKVYKGVEKALSRSMELCLAEKYYKEKYPRGTCILNYPLLNEQLLSSEVKPVEDKLIYTGNVREDRGALIHAAVPGFEPSVTVHFYGQCSKALFHKMAQNAKGEGIFIKGVEKYVPKNEIDNAYMEYNWLAGLATFPPSEHFKKKELTKFFEYMTSGLPIICSNFPVWKDFIDKYDCGITVDPYNKNEIRNAIRFLRENPRRAKTMGENGRKAVLNELNWIAEERKLINWYKKLGENK